MAHSLYTRETLLRKVKDPDDESSWEDFNQYYRGYIYAVAKAMGLGHHDCEDVVQTAMLKAWKNLPTFDYDAGIGKFRSWLATITQNSVRDHLKQRARRPGDFAGTAVEPAHIVSGPEVEALAARQWKVYVSKRAWDSICGELPAKCRAVFELAMAGDSTADIARKVGVSEGSVYVYKGRVKKALQEEIVRIDNELS